MPNVPFAAALRLFAFVVVASISPAIFQSTLRAEPLIPADARFHRERVSADAGRILLTELNCVACHRTDQPQATGMVSKQAPVLDQVAQRVKLDYLATYIADPGGTKAGSTMPNVLAGLPDEERQQASLALAHFLASLHPAGPAQSHAAIGGRARGEALYETAGCAVCHGSRRAEAASLPTDKPLGDLAAKYTIPALAEFLQDPLVVRPGGRMPSLNLTSAEARDIAAYLLPSIPEKSGLMFEYYEGGWDRLPDFTAIKPVAVGEVERIDVTPRQRGDQFALRFQGALLIDTEGTYRFHLGSDDGSRLLIDGKVVVDHDNVHSMQFKSGEVALTTGRHSLVVEMFEAAGDEALKLEYEGPGIDRRDVSDAIVGVEPEEPLNEDKFAVDAQLVRVGRELFQRVGCAACHTLTESEGNARLASRIDAPSLTQLDTKRGCLAKTPVKGIPDFQLSDRQRASIALALLDDAEAASATAESLIHGTLARLNCYACHARGTTGGPFETQLELFRGTQPEMGDEGRLPPHLTGVGAKLTDAWLDQTLASGAEDRPYMLTRMPRFGAANAGHLRELLAEVDKLPPMEAPFASDQETKLAGWQMVGTRGFGCVQCHTFGRFRASGVQSIDLTVMHKRLRPEWFVKYVDSPALFRQGTRMPDAWPNQDGTSLLPNVLDGRNATQIAAVWSYLADGNRARTPHGLNSGTMELIATREAVIYRNFIEGAGTRAIGVGYPEQVNLAFDANRLRLALLWQGAFIDASRHWNGRGEGFQGPAGQAVLRLPEETSIAVLESTDDAWPVEDPRRETSKFRGYRLTEDGRPTFLYDVAGVRVEDAPNSTVDLSRGVLERKLVLRAGKAPKNLFLLAAAGSVEQEQNGWFAIDGRYRVRILGAMPMVRESRGRQELLVRIEFEEDGAEVVQQFNW
jgi:mono/diheme cytochrome c family protein